MYRWLVILKICDLSSAIALSDPVDHQVFYVGSESRDIEFKVCPPASYLVELMSRQNSRTVNYLPSLMGSRSISPRLRLSKPRVSRPRVSRSKVSRSMVPRLRVSRLRITRLRVLKLRVFRLRVTRPRVLRLRVVRLRVSRLKISRLNVSRLKLPRLRAM